MAEPLSPQRSDDDPGLASPEPASPLLEQAATAEAPRSSSLGAILGLADAAVDIVEPLLGGAPAGARFVLVETADDVSIHRVRKGRSEQLAASATALDARSKIARDAARSTNVELRLDPDKIIARRLALPLDGRNFLDAIIVHRLDRLTPWKPENVLYGFRLAPEHTAEGLLDVDFAGTSREVVRDSLARLDRLGIVPTAIGSAAEPIEQPAAIDLLRGRGDRRRLARRRRLRIALLAALPATILLFAASLLALRAQEQRLDGAEAALAAQRSTLVSGVEGDAAERTARALIDGKRAETSAFLLIDRLADAVPSDTFLTDLEIAGQTVRLRGSSANAPALIPILEAVPGLQGVRFEAPVARETDGRDRFDIVASLDAAPDAAPEATGTQ